MVDEPPAAEVVVVLDGVDVDAVAGVPVLGEVVEEVPVVVVLAEFVPVVGVVEPPAALEVLEFDPPLDVDFADDVPDDVLLAVDDVVAPVVADVVVDVDDPDAGGVFADEPVVEVEPDEDVDEEDVDEEVDDFALEVSARATAGLLATAVPIPNAIANAPTRPMYLPSDPAATAACSFSHSARMGSAACRPLVFRGSLSRVIEAVMSPPLPTPGSPAV